MPYKDPEKRRECERRSYRKHKESKLARNAKWIKENKEKHKALCKKWAEKNPEKIKLCSRRSKQKEREREFADKTIAMIAAISTLNEGTTQ
jgi:hypothetical protein